MRRWASAPAAGISTYLLDSIERNKSIEGAKDNFVENVQLFVSHRTDPVNYNLNHGLLNLTIAIEHILYRLDSIEKQISDLRRNS